MFHGFEIAMRVITVIGAEGKSYTCFGELIITISIFKAACPTAVFGNMLLLFHISGLIVTIYFAIIAESGSIVRVCCVTVDKGLIAVIEIIIRMLNICLP